MKQAIYGPPGCGKTTAIVRKIQDFVESGYEEHRIGLCSFTKAGAKELAERANIKTPHASTIHSAAFRQAGIIKDQVMGWRQLAEFSKLTGIEISGANPEEESSLCDGDEYWALYQLMKARMLDNPQQIYNVSHRPGESEVFKYFCETMDEFKKVNGYIDFNDMLLAARSFEAPDVDILFIDEAQDLSPLQWSLIDSWSETIPQVIIAGDDDQAIYVWGGADPRGMTKWESKYGAQRQILQQSYRVPRSVHTRAEALIKTTKHRVDKVYNPRDEEGIINRFFDVNAMKIEHGEDCMVLYRNHSMREDIEEMLINDVVPYITDSGKPGVLQMPSTKVAKIWTRLCYAEKQGLEWSLNGNEKRSARKWLKPWAWNRIEQGRIDDHNRTPWHDAVKMPSESVRYLQRLQHRYGTADLSKLNPTVHLSTIHGSKGREADRVVLLNGMSQRTMDSMELDPCSEIRTFYVGMTRTKNKLDILYGDNPLTEVG